MPSSKSVCIVAPLGQDAPSLASVLTAGGLSPVVHRNLGELAAAMGDEIGAVIMTEEAFGGDVAALRAVLARQPAWSDIPFILLRSARARLGGPRVDMPPEVINAIELERPLGSASLLSATHSALRARLKQFVIRDQMSRLEENQKALAESESELRLVADTAPGLIAFVDANMAFRFANLAHEEWFGVPVQDIVGQTVEHVLGPQGWNEQKENIESALSGQAVHVEVLWPSAEGRRRYAEVRYLPRFDTAGRIDGFHAFASDITVRKVALEATRHQAALLESRVAERTAELEHEMAARQESEAALRQAQKMEAVGQLTGGIAHDFNNMLTGILGAMELVRARLDDGKLDGVTRLLDIASTSAQRAAGLTQRLLAFSRRQSLDPRPVDVRGLVESMEDLFRRTLGERVRLRTSLDGDLPQAMVDANQLESALLNLVINARDAMPDGGEVEVHTSLQRLPGSDGSAESTNPYVLLCVTDNGVGMSEETLSRVFEPFFTTKPIGQGTGLGMSMIYGFINQSHGHVRVKSSPGEGTTICLYLPVASEVAPVQSDLVIAPVEGRGQTILVVDDDLQVRALVTELLEELGYAVEALGSAEEALPLLLIQPFDLLLTDVGLPGLNGRQFAEIARQSRPLIPVLFMTGYAHTAVTRGEFLSDGMSMIAKPFSLVALSEAVDAILRAR